VDLAAVQYSSRVAVVAGLVVGEEEVAQAALEDLAAEALVVVEAAVVGKSVNLNIFAMKIPAEKAGIFIYKCFYISVFESQTVYLNIRSIYSATSPCFAFESLLSPALNTGSVKLLYCSGINRLNFMI